MITERSSPVSERSSLQPILAATLIPGIGLILAATLFGFYLLRHKRFVLVAPKSNAGVVEQPVKPDPYTLAVQRVEQDRGEAVGGKAKIDVPAELKPYKDRQRFLAIQAAEALRLRYRIPQDFPALASMIKAGEFKLAPRLGPGFILYGVGFKAEDDLTLYDPENRKSFPIYSSEDELRKARVEMELSLDTLTTKISDLKNQLSKILRADREARAAIQTQIGETQNKAREALDRRNAVESFYQSREHRGLMVAAYDSLSRFARNFEGQSFDLSDAASRKQLKVAMLSYLRPTALAQLEALGQEYEKKFDRPLPITSLIRTREYQRFLNESGNPNAVQVDIPPHTTGLAFDVYTHYMAATEQQFLMDQIAQLKRDGRVEALRESRDHIHVFCFAK
jgi:hypothetical protein